MVKLVAEGKVAIPANKHHACLGHEGIIIKENLATLTAKDFVDEVDFVTLHCGIFCC